MSGRHGEAGSTSDTQGEAGRHLGKMGKGCHQGEAGSQADREGNAVRAMQAVSSRHAGRHGEADRQVGKMGDLGKQAGRGRPAGRGRFAGTQVRAVSQKTGRHSEAVWKEAHMARQAGK